MDGFATITELEREEYKFSLESILHSGPFKILECLKTRSSSELEDFYDSLKNPEYQPVLTQLMFFQKYLLKFATEIGKEVERIAIENHQRHVESGSEIPYALSRFSEEEINIIAQHLAYLQITHGCGGDCVRKCGVDAVPGVRDRIPLEHVISTLELIAENGNGNKYFRAYYASDPLEAAESLEDFFKISRAYFQLFKKPLVVVTSIPRGTEELYKELCRRKDNSVSLDVSITEENIRRLHEQGILNHGNINDILLYPGVNKRIPIGVFNEKYTPSHANLITNDYREKVGINGFNKPGIKRNFWNKTALIMTPYGILNTVAIPRVDMEYPQGRVVVTLDYLDDEEIEFPMGEQIDTYLSRCLVKYGMSNESYNRFFYATNLSHDTRVLIDGNGKVITSDNTISEPGFGNF